MKFNKRTKKSLLICTSALLLLGVSGIINNNTNDNTVNAKRVNRVAHKSHKRINKKRLRKSNKYIKRNKANKRTNRYNKNKNRYRNKNRTRKHVNKKYKHFHLRKHRKRNKTIKKHVNKHIKNTKNTAHKKISNSSNSISHDGITIPKNSDGYQTWFAHQEETNSVADFMHVSKYDLAYNQNHSIDTLDSTYFYQPPVPRRKVEVESPNEPIWSLRSHAELEIEKNPFRNWSQSQFDQYTTPIIAGYNNDGNNPRSTSASNNAWWTITHEFSDADQNAQQAAYVADNTWDN